MTIEQYKEKEINSPSYQQSAAVGMWLSSLKAKMKVSDVEILTYYKNKGSAFTRIDENNKRVQMSLKECRDKIISRIKRNRIYKMYKPGGMIYTNQKIKIFVK